MKINTEVTNAATYRATLDHAEVARLLGEAVLREALGALPPDGGVKPEVTITPNIGEDGRQTIQAAVVTVTVDKLKPAQPGRVMAVTRRQAVQALILAGLDDDVAAALEAIPDPTQKKLMKSWYFDSLTFERDRPELTMMASALQLDDAALDALFAKAQTL